MEKDERRARTTAETTVTQDNGRKRDNQCGPVCVTKREREGGISKDNKAIKVRATATIIQDYEGKDRDLERKLMGERERESERMKREDKARTAYIYIYIYIYVCVCVCVCGCVCVRMGVREREIETQRVRETGSNNYKYKRKERGNK